MTRETIVPSIPDVSEDNLTEVVRAIKSVIQVREGQIGDPLDQVVTLRDLMALGVAENTGSTTNNGGGVIPVVGVLPPEGDGYNPATDYTVPPAPTGLTGTATFKNVYLQWDGAPYRNHNYTEIWRASANVLGSAQRVGTTPANVYPDPVQNAGDYYYWIRFVSAAGVEGPFSSSNGLAVNVPQDVNFLLTALSGQITETQLYSALGTRINLIDASASVVGSVAYRIAQESSARASAITTEVTNRTNAIASEASTRAQAILDEAAARSTADSSLQSQINTIVAAGSSDTSTILAALQTEQTARIAGDNAQATARETLAAQIRGSYTGTDPSALTTGLMYTERQARVSAEGALASSISSLQATVSSNQSSVTSAITTEQSVRASADSALSSSISALSSQVNDVSTGLPATRSKLLSEYSTTTTMNEAIASATQALVSQTSLSTQLGAYVTNANLTTNYYTKTATDSAISSATSQLVSQTSLNTALSSYATNAALSTNYYTKAATDSAISVATQNLVSTTSLTNTLANYATNATLTNNYYTKTATDSAISQATSSLVSTTALNNALGSYVTTATLTTNYYTKTDTDSAISTQTSTLSARLNNFNGSGVSLEVASSAQASTVSGLSAQYTVKIDNNGHVSGFGLASTSTTSGPSSAFIVRADRFAIAGPNDASDPLGTITPSRLPFIVTTTPTTIGGRVYPAGTWIDTAFVANATIDTAMISSLTADKITTGSLTAAIGITTGRITGGVNTNFSFGSSQFGTGFFLGLDSSVYKFRVGSPTQNMTWDGSVLSVTGTITAVAGTFRNITVYDTNDNVILSSSGINQSLLGLGSLAYQSSVSTAQVTGLGTLATQNNVSAGQVTGLGSLATSSEVFVGSNVKIWNGSSYIVLNTEDFVSKLSRIGTGNISAFIDGAAITDAYIGSLNAEKITAGFISADRLSSAVISAKVANIDAAVVTTGTFGSARIGNAAIDTLKIGNNAVTIPLTYESSAQYSATGTVLTYNFNMPYGGKVIVLWQGQTDSARYFYFRIYLNSTPGGGTPPGYIYVGYPNGDYVYDAETNGYMYVGSGGGDYIYSTGTPAAPDIGNTRTGGAFEDAPTAIGFGTALTGNNTVHIYWQRDQGTLTYQRLIILGAQR